MRVLGIDPGERTGVALVDVSTEQAPVLLMHEEVYGGLSGFSVWWEDRPDYDVLVCEDFLLRQGLHGVNLEPVRIIAFLEPYAPVMQPPAGRKKAVSDNALKRLGLYLPGEKQRNAREAVRHVVWFLKRTHHIPTLRIGWPD